jgi:CBS domain containing-hemolysin-like protein
VEQLGTIPKEDEHPVVNYRSLTFTVLEVIDRRVSRLRIERDPEWTEETVDDEK